MTGDMQIHLDNALDKIGELVQEKTDLERQLAESEGAEAGGMVREEVTSEDIASVVARWARPGSLIEIDPSRGRGRRADRLSVLSVPAQQETGSWLALQPFRPRQRVIGHCETGR